MSMSSDPSNLDAEELLEATALDVHTAASVGDLERIVAIDNDGGDDVIQTGNRHRWTPLMYAAYYDHGPVLSYLCNIRSVAASEHNDKGRTALMMAAMCGNVDATVFLIQRFAGTTQILRAVDKLGYTALFHAGSCGHADVTKLLLEAGSDANVIEESQGFSPLMVACREGHEMIVHYLVHFGAEIAYTNILGESAQSVAAKHGNDRIVKFLAKVVNSRNKTARSVPSVLDGPAAALLAAKSKSAVVVVQPDVMAFLQDAGVEKYCEVFADVGGLQTLLELTDQDLKDMGVTLLGPRRKITSALARMQNNKQ